MGSVAHLYDPEGDDLIRLAEAAGGAENLSEGERWRLANTLDRRRRLEAQANAPDGRTDALDARANRAPLRRPRSAYAMGERDAQGGPAQVVGEVIGEGRARRRRGEKAPGRVAHRNRPETERAVRGF